MSPRCSKINRALRHDRYLSLVIFSSFFSLSLSFFPISSTDAVSRKNYVRSRLIETHRSKGLFRYPASLRRFSFSFANRYPSLSFPSRSTGEDRTLTMLLTPSASLQLRLSRSRIRDCFAIYLADLFKCSRVAAHRLTGDVDPYSQIVSLCNTTGSEHEIFARKLSFCEKIANRSTL